MERATTQPEDRSSECPHCGFELDLPPPERHLGALALERAVKSSQKHPAPKKHHNLAKSKKTRRLDTKQVGQMARDLIESEDQEMINAGLSV